MCVIVVMFSGNIIFVLVIKEAITINVYFSDVSIKFVSFFSNISKTYNLKYNEL